MKIKKELQEKEFRDNREHYLKVGKNASDSFYIHQDKQDAKHASLRGGSKHASDALNEEYFGKLESVKNRRIRQAALRKRTIEEMRLEDE